MEKAYRTMKNSGAGSIVIGIIILVTGVAAGVISIVNGASLLKIRTRLHFKGQSPPGKRRGLFMKVQDFDE